VHDSLLGVLRFSKRCRRPEFTSAEARARKKTIATNRGVNVSTQLTPLRPPGRVVSSDDENRADRPPVGLPVGKPGPPAGYWLLIEALACRQQAALCGEIENGVREIRDPSSGDFIESLLSL